MKIKAWQESFVLPEEGEHLATFVRYEDLGMQPNAFKPGEEIHKVRLIWRLKGGVEQFQKVNVTMHPQSNLYEIVTALLGDNPPAEPELDDLIGKNAYITIEHQEDRKQKGKMWANIVDIRPVSFKGRKLPGPAAAAVSAATSKLEITDDDIPFVSCVEGVIPTECSRQWLKRKYV